MHQLIRTTVAPQGYTLFSVVDQRVAEEPLDVPSSNVPHVYLQVQHRVDAFTELTGRSWCMAMAYDGPTQTAAVGFGSLFRLADDRGRTGITYLHAVVLTRPTLIPAVVLGVIRFLNPTVIDQLLESVGQVAQQQVGADDFVAWAAEHLRAGIPPEAPPSRPFAGAGSRINEVVHDCGGASAVAWLTLAGNLSGDGESWEVFDEYRRAGEAFATRATWPGRTALASEMLATLAGVGEEGSPAVPPPRDEPETGPSAGGQEPPGPAAPSLAAERRRAGTTWLLFAVILAVAAVSFVGLFLLWGRVGALEHRLGPADSVRAPVDSAALPVSPEHGAADSARLLEASALCFPQCLAE